jgi:hypothetical protein
MYLCRARVSGEALERFLAETPRELCKAARFAELRNERDWKGARNLCSGKLDVAGRALNDRRKPSEKPPTLEGAGGFR